MNGLLHRLNGSDPLAPGEAAWRSGGCELLRRLWAMLPGVPPVADVWFELLPCAEGSDEADQLDRLLEQAAAVTAGGCARIWVSVRPGLAAVNDALRLALAVALRCEGVRVVAAGLVFEHWIRLAEDAATADAACGGRMELAFRAPPQEGPLESMRGAWAGARVRVEPGAGAEPATIEVHPRPVRRDGPPLWSLVSDESEAQLAGELELGAVTELVSVLPAHRTAAGGLPLPAALVVSVESSGEASEPALVQVERVELR